MTKLDLSYANKGLKIKSVAIHDGKFHADDVFAAMLIRAIYPGVEVVRSREDAVLDECDIVIDVGLKYNFEDLRFDHHQVGKAGHRENGIEYSGFGLIWRHWGMDICKGNQDLYDDIDRKLVQPVDANDNSQALYGEPNYKGVHNFNLDDIMSSAMNPTLSEAGQEDERFVEAMDLVEIIFARLLKKREEVLTFKDAIIKEYEDLEDKRFIIDEHYRPVLSFSKFLPDLYFYVYPNQKGDRWMMMTSQPDSDYRNSKDLPKEWAGKSGKELEEVSGIKDMDFCHNALFICGAKSKVAILEALKVALEY